MTLSFLHSGAVRSACEHIATVFCIFDRQLCWANVGNDHLETGWIAGLDPLVKACYAQSGTPSKAANTRPAALSTFDVIL